MSVLDDTKEALVELRDEQRLLSFRHDDIGFIAGYLITTIRNAGRDAARRETLANEDVTKCAKCGLRTVGQFCGECVKKFAEVEQLAAQILPHLAAADAIWSGIKDKEAGTPRDHAVHSFELAEAFVKERDARRGAKP